MDSFIFKAFAFGGELDLNRLAQKFEVKHKSETLLDMTDVFSGLGVLVSTHPLPVVTGLIEPR